ncbi:hypothetical protein BASA83_007732 [Batrachochytrium salamandrivorans]|nr:hypothetical protein BASA81_014118 [Batrachochytrium salamandrivorans]KAH9270209.1 hypothetical protein BASA83_007732 [Batrachochytrium salamandrivorans]
MAFVELRKITVKLVVSRNLVHAIPLGWSNIGNRCTMAGVEEESISIVTQKNVAHSVAFVDIRKSTVVLAVSRHLVYVIPLIRLDLCKGQTRSCVEDSIITNAHQTFVARNMAFVNKRETAVALTVKRHLVSVIPVRMSNPEKCQAMASVERGRSLGVSQETVAPNMVLVELRVITVVLAVKQILVYVIPYCLFQSRLPEHS